MSADPFSWPEDRRIAALRADLAATKLPGYSIASDGIEEWLWRDVPGHPDRPEQVLPKRALRGHPAV